MQKIFKPASEMDLGHFSSLKRNCLIELVILPGMDVSPIISTLLAKHTSLIILDTSGNLFQIYGDMPYKIGCDNKDGQSFDSDDIELTRSLPDVDYSFVTSVNDLFEKISLCNRLSDFLLVIDNVPYLSDFASGQIKRFSRELWSLIYECNSTIVAINHYRIGKVERSYKLIPRVGEFWSRMVTYRVKFFIKSNTKINFEIEENDFETM